jgi:MbtH protein
MSFQDGNDDSIYIAVINEEEQYSIWPEHKAIPLGWRDAGMRGPKADCLAHIDKVWTDMRPRSLRMQMDQKTN